MIAIINVTNNHSFIERGLQTLHKTEIFTLLSCVFFPKRKQKFAAKTKMIELLQVGAIVYFLGHHVYTGAILVYPLVLKQREASRGVPTGILGFHLLQCIFVSLLSPSSQ